MPTAAAPYPKTDEHVRGLGDLHTARPRSEPETCKREKVHRLFTQMGLWSTKVRRLASPRPPQRSEQQVAKPNREEREEDLNPKGLRVNTALCGSKGAFAAAPEESGESHAWASHRAGHACGLGF